MTPEELNRTIEFIIQNQARLAAAQEQDRYDRLKFEEWSKTLFARMDQTDAQIWEANAETNARFSENNTRLEQNLARLTENDARLTEINARLSALSVRQTDLLDHQSQRMDRLDKFYEEWLRQNGDFQRQVIHLLNMVLDRLPPSSNPN